MTVRNAMPNLDRTEFNDRAEHEQYPYNAPPNWQR